MEEFGHLQYAHDVLEEREVAGKLMKLACKRSLDDHHTLPNDDFPWVFTPEAVMPRLRFMHMMPLVKGAKWYGKRMMLSPWQLWNICEVWGWRHKDDKHRLRFRQSVWEIAKGAGKTPVVAGEALFALRFGEPGTQIISFASRLPQAKLCFKEASAMILNSKFPRKLLGSYDVTASVIRCPQTHSVFEAMPSTPRSLDGFVISYLIFDEAASLTRRERVMDILSAARKLPSAHTRWITTAQPAARDTLYYERRQHGIDVLEGRSKDDRLHVAIYTVDEEDMKGNNWMNPACWPKANPSLHKTQDIDMLTEALEEAKHSPSTRSANLAKHLNIYAGSTTSWLDSEEWYKCILEGSSFEDPREWLDYLASQGVDGKLSIGFDLAETRDLTAVTLALMGEDGNVYTHFKTFCPRVALDKIPTDVREIWEVAIAEDVLYITEGPTTEYEFVEEYIREIVEHVGNALENVCCDRHNATDLVERLENDDIPIMAVKQSTTALNAPTKRLERLVANKRLKHSGEGFIAWQLGNCQIYRSPNGNVRLSKPTSLSPFKIDSFAALVNAIAGISEASSPEADLEFHFQTYPA